MSKRVILLALIVGTTLATQAVENPDPKPTDPTPVTPVAPVKGDKPPKTSDKAAGRDWHGIFRNLQSADNVNVATRDAAVTDFLRGIADVAQKSKKPYFAKLQADIASADLKIHDEACKRVAVIGQIISLDPKRFKPLLAGLASEDAKVRNEQLEYMFKTTEDSLQTDHIRDLIDQLGPDDKTADGKPLDPAALEAQKVQIAKAYEELKTFGGDAADELANELDNEKVAVKKMCADLLKEMGPGAKDAINSLIFKLQDSEDKFGRKYAAQILENLGPDGKEAVDDLVLRLDDDDKPLRRICANILKKMGTAYKDATPDLIVYLTHDDKTVRALASELLIGLGPDAKIGVQDLVEVIDEAPVPPPPANNVPQKNGVAAANVPDPLANDIDSKIRAAKVLANIGPAAKEALPGLVKFTNDKDPDLKDAVRAAIDKITEGKPIEPILQTIEKAKPKEEKPAEKPKTETRPGENF